MTEWPRVRQVGERLAAPDVAARGILLDAYPQNEEMAAACATASGGSFDVDLVLTLQVADRSLPMAPAPPP